MTIADEKIKASSERFMLFKVTPKKNIDTSLSLDSGIIYTMSQENPVESIKRNGSELTNVSTTSPAADQWYWDKDSKTLYVGLSSAPNSTSNVVIMFFNLYLTGEKTRYLQDDPVTPSGDVVEWEPKILSYPTISQSVKNVLSGVFSFSSISFQVIDTDDKIKDLLDEKTTFNNSDVVGYQSINDEIIRVYRGKVKAIRPRGVNVTFNILDNFSRLSSRVTMGDAEDEIIATRSDYPGLDRDLEEANIPFFIGKTTYGEIKPQLDLYSNKYRGITEGTNEAINIANLTDTIQGGDTGLETGFNNLFILGRVGPGGIADQDPGTVSAVTHDIGSEFVIVTASGHNLKYSDAFQVKRSDNNFQAYCYVVEVTSTGYTLMTVDPTFAVTSPSNASEQLTPGNITFEQLHKSIQLRFKYKSTEPTTVVSGNTTNYSAPFGFLPLAGTYIEETLPSGNKLIKVDLDNMQLGFLQPFFDPSKHRLMFTMTPVDTHSHGELVQEFCELSGLSVNTSSITQADTDLDENCMFQIPLRKQNKYPTYQQLLQKMLSSTFGVLYLDESLDVNYKIIQAPVSGDEIDDNLALERSSRVLIEYNDIVTKLEADNIHYNRLVSESFGDSPFASEIDDEAKYLNEIDNEKSIDHLLENFTSQASKILGFLAKRRVEYSFDVATEIVDKLISEDLTLSTFNILGGSSSENVKIFGIKKSNDKMTATTIDLKGL